MHAYLPLASIVSSDLVQDVFRSEGVRGSRCRCRERLQGNCWCADADPLSVSFAAQFFTALKPSMPHACSIMFAWVSDVDAATSTLGPVKDEVVDFPALLRRRYTALYPATGVADPMTGVSYQLQRHVAFSLPSTCAALISLPCDGSKFMGAFNPPHQETLRYICYPHDGSDATSYVFGRCKAVPSETVSVGLEDLLTDR